MTKNFFDVSTVNTFIQVGGVIITILAGLLTLLLNERTKRKEDEYKRKEERYTELVSSLRGFHLPLTDKSLEENFLIQLDLCWLYCPDDVIQKAYGFLSLVAVGQERTDSEKEKAVGELMLAIRKDLLARGTVRTTKMRPEDFKVLRVV
jgi:hypothetical protein